MKLYKKDTTKNAVSLQTRFDSELKYFNKMKSNNNVLKLLDYNDNCNVQKSHCILLMPHYPETDLSNWLQKKNKQKTHAVTKQQFQFFFQFAVK